MTTANWTLDIYPSDSSEPVSVTFLATDEIDDTQISADDLAAVNAILPSTFSRTEIASFWDTITWIFVSFFWMCLDDLGETSPTIYPSTDTNLPFANATILPPTNNILVNQILFDKYSSFLQTAVLNATLNFSEVGPINSIHPLLKKLLLCFDAIKGVGDSGDSGWRLCNDEYSVRSSHVYYGNVLPATSGRFIK